jgi:hypothetical protein
MLCAEEACASGDGGFSFPPRSQAAEWRHSPARYVRPRNGRRSAAREHQAGEARGQDRQSDLHEKRPRAAERSAAPALNPAGIILLQSGRLRFSIASTCKDLWTYFLPIYIPTSVPFSGRLSARHKRRSFVPGTVLPCARQRTASPSSGSFRRLHRHPCSHSRHSLGFSRDEEKRRPTRGR